MLLLSGNASACPSATAGLPVAVAPSAAINKAYNDEQRAFLTDPDKYLAGVNYNFAQAYQNLIR